MAANDTPKVRFDESLLQLARLWRLRTPVAIVARMRVVLIQIVALLLTLIAWSSDVLHVMHLGADETLAQHESTTGNEEPDAPRNDGLTDEVAIEHETITLCLLPRNDRARVEQLASPEGDDHSLALMRPPRTTPSA